MLYKLRSANRTYTLFRTAHHDKFPIGVDHFVCNIQVIHCFYCNTIGVDYLENNCAEEPNKLCEFKRLSGRILKTVDSVYQDVSNIDECRELCLNSPYR